MDEVACVQRRAYSKTTMRNCTWLTLCQVHAASEVEMAVEVWALILNIHTQQCFGQLQSCCSPSWYCSMKRLQANQTVQHAHQHRHELCRRCSHAGAAIKSQQLACSVLHQQVMCLVSNANANQMPLLASQIYLCLCQGCSHDCVAFTHVVCTLSL